MSERDLIDRWNTRTKDTHDHQPDTHDRRGREVSEFEPIDNIKDLALQDDEEMLQGYRSGLANDPEPGSDKSRSFWHGWRNGKMDRGTLPIDFPAAELARQIVRKQNAH